MLLGSNNSMTYLSPSTWWAKIFGFIGKCQRISFEDQYTYQGVRLFDIRIYKPHNSNHMVIKNGNVYYNTFSLFNVFDLFNKMEDVTVRLTLDISLNERLSDAYNSIQVKFVEYCNMIETIYPSIKFIGGRRRYDGKRLYHFKYEKENGTPFIIEGFDEFSWIDRLFPFIPAMKNKKLIEKYKDEHGFLMLNFVDKK